MTDSANQCREKPGNALSAGAHAKDANAYVMEMKKKRDAIKYIRRNIMRIQ